MRALLQRLFPAHADNAYAGSRIALWLFGLVAAVKTLQGTVSMVNPYSVATGADGIPLSSYPPAASAEMIALFSLLGLLLAILGALCLLVLIRYRSLVPLMFSILALHFVAGRAIFLVHPISRVGSPIGVYVNLGLFLFMVIGIGLSLTSRPSTIGSKADAAQVASR